MEPQMNVQDDLAGLEKETANVRRNLAWDPNQLPEIHKLYFRYVGLGRPFPADLEEHSLWLILKFIRPDDNKAADRLVTVLQEQGKPVPDDLKSLATRDFAVSYEEIANHRRSDAASTTAPDSPLHKRLFFVVSLPKSASRLMVSVLAAMHPIERFRRPTRLPYATGCTGIDVTADLRYDGLIGCAEGGIIHSHLSPTSVTRHALAHLALGHVITIRHPADHIAALYCHIRRITKLSMLDDNITARLGDEPLPDPASSFEAYARRDEPSRLFFHDVVFPVDVRFFARSVSVDDTIAHLIACGYLYYALTWIVSWQLLHIRNISAIVRYEDFISNPEATLRQVNDVLFPEIRTMLSPRGTRCLLTKITIPLSIRTSILVARLEDKESGETTSARKTDASTIPYANSFWLPIRMDCCSNAYIRTCWQTN